MSEIVSFASLTRTALKDFFQDRSLWWIALPAGSFIALSSFFATRAEQLLEGTDTKFFADSIVTGPDLSFLFFVSLSLIFALAQSPLRGITVLLLQSVHLNQTSKTSSKLRKADFLRVVKTAFFFESGFWIIILLLGFILLIPTLLAWRFNQDALPAVSQFGFILLITVSIYLYLIKELSLLYSLLGNTSLRGSIDLGFQIFRRHSFLTLLFFIYLSMIAVIATLSISLTSAALIFFNAKGELFRTLLAVPLFGLYFIFDQALRLAYFRKIASRPKTPAEKISATKQTEPVTGMTNI